MKTAISVPDETFADVERCAAELGVSRSEFFTMAAKRFVIDIRHVSVTQQINVVLDMNDSSGDDPAEFAVAAGRATLLAGDDDW